ncbi:MAG: hypothetical protein AAF242_19610 [Bacteroidota bacterium]
MICFLSWRQLVVARPSKFIAFLSDSRSSWYPITNCLLILSFIPALGNSQTDTLQIISSFERKDELLAIDQLQQLYFINDQQTVTKTDVEGKLLFEYNNFRLGELAYLDVTDPFGALAFYRDFGTIILLDRTLNPLTELNLGALGYFSIDLVATSRDNQIWIYDQQDFKLKKINQQGQLLSESQDLSLTFPQGIQGLSLKAIGNQVYLQDEEYGLLEFNQFGQFLRQIPFLGRRVVGLEGRGVDEGMLEPTSAGASVDKKGVRLLDVVEPYLILGVGNQIFVYEPSLARTELLFEAGKKDVKLLLVRNWLVEQEGKQIRIYKIPGQ